MATIPGRSTEAFDATGSYDTPLGLTVTMDRHTFEAHVDKHGAAWVLLVSVPASITTPGVNYTRGVAWRCGQDTWGLSCFGSSAEPAGGPIRLVLQLGYKPIASATRPQP